MRYGLDDVRGGFDVSADVVVVGSGPGGAVAADNLARAGMKVVVLEAGPEVRPEDMVRDTPRFLARNFWEGGLRIILGTAPSPSMHARCLGGGSVVNSAIMLPLPKWVRQEWQSDAGVAHFDGPELDAAYARVFARCRVAPTPMTVFGRRNLLVRDAIEGVVGEKGGGLPRAVDGCEASSDCLTGCASGKKQSVDRVYLPAAEAAGAEVYTHSQVDGVLVEGKRAVGVVGDVIELPGWRKVGRFRVRAKLVVLAAGTMHTPVLLQKSGINPRGRVGATLFCHVGGGLVGIMDEVVDPWVGATQGWGAISQEIRGLKYEGLWASPAVLMVRWGDVGRRFVERLDEVKRAVVIAIVYRGDVHGTVKATRSGDPSMRLWIPEKNVQPVMRGMKNAADALLSLGARYVHTGLVSVVNEMKNQSDTASLLSPRVKARHMAMTMNHTFGSCRMTVDESGPVDPDGKLKGLEGLYICDASVFPSPSAVNPQATIMALSDITSRKLGELSLHEPPV
ncbi:MAG: GMC family oxidoreductase [Polyangiaceae bacterium]|nr:GMC family oxidoreductase [Polyangiaceae bacterium]MCE7890033.1 GMC family oxidoreductase [Sorangiineae bacterium PRO1]MCL4750864.1 GMC family oxidoreductase N-terminal domain-containing protein [Myxococcales bacterium]